MECLVLLLAAMALVVHSRPSNIHKIMKTLKDKNGLKTKDTRPYFLTVTLKPNTTAVHKPGTILEIVCDALGSPAPRIHWYKNDEPINEETYEMEKTNPTSLARLTSRVLVTSSEDGDKFTCVAISGRKTTKLTTEISHNDSQPFPELMYEESEIRQIPLTPYIASSYNVLVDVINSTIVLPCKAVGHPKPAVHWFRSNGVDSIQGHPRIQVLHSGDLKISRLQWEDMGEFVCRVENAFGWKSTRTFVYPAKAG